MPVTVPGRRGKPDVVVDRDEHPRPETTLEQLAALRPVRQKIDDASTVTAGNASGQNDGAAMCVVTTREEAERRGLRPLLALRSWAVAGVGPEVMGIGPVPATAAALDRAGLTLDEIDLIELNEAFAAQVLACLREWKVDPTDERLNPNGSGISLGHPVGATGARILATMAHEMQRRESRYGLETMCIGGGQGLAAIFERVALDERRRGPPRRDRAGGRARRRPVQLPRLHDVRCGTPRPTSWPSTSASSATTPAATAARPSRRAPTTSTTSPTTSSPCSTPSAWRRRTSSASRWAA